jgi:dephospho-CoA kinase
LTHTPESVPSPRFVIGLTGLPSSGKGEVAEALSAAAAKRGWRVERLVFSDQIKEEARRRGIPDERFTRELMAEIGTELREKEGPGAIARRIAARIREWPEPRSEMFVADGLRHVGEAHELRSAFAERFLLVGVDSEPREIARRLIARHRSDESPEALQSEEKAVALLEEELNGKRSAMGPNVGQCMERADVILPNHGNLDDLRRTVAEFLNRLIEKA